MKIKKHLKLAAFFVCSLVIGATGAQAQIADSACDSSYYDSLKARAWLEAQREITQNQNLIAKPDSVLAYSCFDKFAFELASATRNMFSETDRWNSASGSSLGDTTEPLIGVPFGINMIYNFDHSFRGGRGPGSPNPDGPVSAASANSYNCNVMNSVWMAAKCANFVERPADGFFTLAEYKDSADKRELPLACGQADGWANKYIAAGLDDNTGPPWMSDDADGYPDPAKPGGKLSYSKLTDPANCGDTAPVATGLTVTREKVTSGPREFEEKICIQPGCYYDPAGGTCVTSF